MPYRIIVYDIPSDSLRATVAQTLLDYGLERVQYSVFTGRLTPNLTEELTIALRDKIKTKPADVRIFTICTHLKDSQIIVSELPLGARPWQGEDPDQGTPGRPAHPRKPDITQLEQKVLVI
ncbi:MAG: CRISPR-associated endonuclease Cas2 [Candidatus Bathyarchaeia archaeon]